MSQLQTICYDRESKTHQSFLKEFSTAPVKAIVQQAIEEKLSAYMLDNESSNKDIDAVLRMFAFLEKRNNEASIQMMLRLSKLPLKSPRTFANFDFSQVHEKNVSQLEGLQSLSTLYSHKNVALIGPAGMCF